MRQALLFFTTVLLALAAGGCVRFHGQPMSPEKSGAEFNARTLTDAGLRTFLQTNGVSGEVWNFNSLAWAAFYFHPSLDVARATWGVASAGKSTAGQRPNPILSVAPGYNTSAGVPSPWIVTPSLDIPIETAGKRGYRINHARQLSEAARLQIVSVAWQVRGAVRRNLVNLHASESREALLKKQLIIQTANVRLIEAQLQAGAVSAFEVTQARVALNQMRFAVHDVARSAVIARLQLADAIGIPPAALDSIQFNFEELENFPAVVPNAEARRQALFNRTDILGALAEYAATEAALQLEIARQYPDVHLGPGYNYDQGENKWSLGLSVTLPLLNQNEGPIAEAQARRAESAAKFHALQTRVLSEIEQAVVTYRMALQKAGAAVELNNELAAQLRTVEAMLAAGEISRLELAQRQLELSTATLAQLDAQFSVQMALGALDDALQSPATLISANEHSPRVSTNSQP